MGGIKEKTPIPSCLILESNESSMSGKCRIKLRPWLRMKLLGACVLGLWVGRLTNYFIIDLETVTSLDNHRSALEGQDLYCTAED